MALHEHPAFRKRAGWFRRNKEACINAVMIAITAAVIVIGLAWESRSQERPLHSINDGSCISHFVKAWGNATGMIPLLWTIDPQVRAVAEGNCIRLYACRDKHLDDMVEMCAVQFAEFNRSLQSMQVMTRKENN